MRVSRVNSEEETKKEDIEELKRDLIKSGYKEEELEEIHQNLLNKETQDQNSEGNNLEEKPPVIFSFKYFHQMNELKKVVRGMNSDLDSLMGHHNIIFAARKGVTIGNEVVKNRDLCIPNEQRDSQKCGCKGCETCPTMLDTKSIKINGQVVKLARNVTCKSGDVTYVHICQSCGSENCYGGQTSQPFANRNTGHRNKFNMHHYEESALSHHSYLEHGLNVKLDNFKCAIVKKCNFLNLDREEFKLVERLRCKTMGLNRCKISK